MNARPVKTFLLATALLALAMPAHASAYFKADETTRTGYANVMNNWWTSTSYSAHPSGLNYNEDGKIMVGHTCLVNNNLTQFWNIEVRSTDPDHPATIRILPGGKFNCNWEATGALLGGWGAIPTDAWTSGRAARTMPPWLSATPDSEP